MKFNFAPLFLCIGLSAGAQTPGITPEYSKAVDIALGELQKGQCQPCLEAYERAFSIANRSALSHLRAARCAQMCGDQKKAEAFAADAIAISWDMTRTTLLSREYAELAPLADSELGKRTLDKATETGKSSGVNFELAQQVGLLADQDQKYRRTRSEYQSKYGANSPEYQAFARESKINDSLCLAQAEAIIAQYGYPGKSMVGESHQDDIWLVIQHAPLDKQEKYFPLIDAAAAKDELRKSSWALLVDRIRMYKHEPQVFGSQVVRDEITGGWKFHEIEDEANVNKRRAEVGLGPLEEYAARMGVNWKPK